MRDPADIEITAEDLKADMSERGVLEWELATLRATNRKLAAMVRQNAQTIAALRATDETTVEGKTNGNRAERVGRVSGQE